jgi:hypothetical protein
MEKDKLISFITSHQSFEDYSEVIEWINTIEENKEEYIRYKNLWAILQHGNDMPEILRMLEQDCNQCSLLGIFNAIFFSLHGKKIKQGFIDKLTPALKAATTMSD